MLLPTKKSKALLAYLALAPGQPRSRSLVASLFWDEAGETQARESLRQTLSLLRRTLLPAHAQPILSEGDAIALEPNVLAVDALEFERLAEAGEPDALANAANLYSGELLEGFDLDSPEFDRWLLAVRQGFREKMVNLLSRMLAHHLAVGNLERAASTATRLLTLDPLRESSHRALMELYSKQGRYAAALRQYQTCCEVLARELNIEPEPGTTALYREIRSQRNAPRESASKTEPMRRGGENGITTAHALERRQITILTYELIGLDALSAELEPEALVAVASVCRRQWGAVIQRFGGHIERFASGRFTALFGFPKANEHSAEQAVRAGLALVMEAHGPETLPPGRLAARVGIATSQVVAGELSEERAEAALALIGEAPRIANLLQIIAPPNAILISRRTKDLVGDLFECSAVPAPSFAATTESGPFWQVLGETHDATRFTAMHRPEKSPFVGREAELDDLIALSRSVEHGEGHVAFITGEPGIGKSRLALEFQARLGTQPHGALFYQCSPFHTNSALYPFIRELERAANFQHSDNPEQKLGKLAALVSAYAPAKPDITRLVAQLMSIPAQESDAAPRFSPAQLRRKTLGALLDRVVSFAGREPLLVLFEDAHWADASSLEVLDLLVDRIRTRPVLLLITARPGFEPAWAGLEHVRQIALDRIIDQHARTLVQNMSPGWNLPMGLVDQIIVKTDGVPLFLEEMTQALLEADRAAGLGSGTKLLGGGPNLRIPATLHDSLMARLDHLGEAKATAQIAAVIGREFSQDLLRAVAGPSADRLDDDLELLGSSGLIFEQPSQSGRSFAFKHALVCDTAYQSLLKGRRQQLHGAIAGTIREAFPAVEKNHPELVAHHFTKAGLIAPALGYWAKAGMHALLRSANREAIAHLEHGLELVPALEAPADRRRWERQLLAVMGPAVMAVEGYAAAKSQRVFEKARELIDEECPPQEKLRIICGLWNLRSQQGQLTAALPLAEEFLVLAQKSNMGLELGNCMMGINLSAMGDFERAHRHLLDVLESFRLGTQAPAVIFGIDELILAHAYLARVLWSMGHPEQAAVAAAKGFSLTLQGASSVSTALAFVARLFLNAQNPEASGSEQLIEDAAAHAIEHELPPFQNWFAFFGAAIRLRQGHAAEALPVMQATIANADSKQNWLFRPFQLGCVAEALLQLGEADRALTAIDEAIHTGEMTGEKQSEANLYRVKGEILSALEHPVDAQRAFQTGLAVARQQKARTEELRVALSMVRLQQNPGDARDARAALAHVYATFDEGFDLQDLRAARATL